MKFLITGLLTSFSILSLSVIPAFADKFTGTIVAYDRVEKVIVMKDKTIYDLGVNDIELPEDLQAGDRVEIDATDGGEDGVGTVVSIKRLK